MLYFLYFFLIVNGSNCLSFSKESSVVYGDFKKCSDICRQYNIIIVGHSVDMCTKDLPIKLCEFPYPSCQESQFTFNFLTENGIIVNRSQQVECPKTTTVFYNDFFIAYRFQTKIRVLKNEASKLTNEVNVNAEIPVNKVRKVSQASSNAFEKFTREYFSTDNSFRLAQHIWETLMNFIATVFFVVCSVKNRSLISRKMNKPIKWLISKIINNPKMNESLINENDGNERALFTQKRGPFATEKRRFSLQLNSTSNEPNTSSALFQQSSRNNTRSLNAIPSSTTTINLNVANQEKKLIETVNEIAQTNQNSSKIYYFCPVPQCEFRTEAGVRYVKNHLTIKHKELPEEYKRDLIKVIKTSSG